MLQQRKNNFNIHSIIRKYGRYKISNVFWSFRYFKFSNFIIKFFLNFKVNQNVDGFILTNEVAFGHHPIETMQTLNRIIM